jgi:hypothetical protein
MAGCAEQPRRALERALAPGLPRSTMECAIPTGKRFARQSHAA